MAKSLTSTDSSPMEKGQDKAHSQGGKPPGTTAEQRVRVADDLDLASTELGKLSRDAVGARTTRLHTRRPSTRRERKARVVQRRNSRHAAKTKGLPNGIFKNPVYPYPRDPLGKVITFLANFTKVLVRFLLALLGAKKGDAPHPSTTPHPLTKEPKQSAEQREKPKAGGDCTFLPRSP